jgi:hypothetical protein
MLAGWLAASDTLDGVPSDKIIFFVVVVEVSVVYDCYAYTERIFFVNVLIFFCVCFGTTQMTGDEWRN